MPKSSDRIYNFQELVTFSIVSQAVCAFCFLLSAISLRGNEFAGAVGIITGIIYASFTGFCYYGIVKRPTRLGFGVVLGLAFVLVFISLEAAIFWGQYANCSLSSLLDSNASQRYMLATSTELPSSMETTSSSSSSSRSHVRTNRLFSTSTYTAECNNRPGMRSACAFSVLMFLNYLFFILVLLRFKDDVLGSAGQFDDYLSVPTSENAGQLHYPVSASEMGNSGPGSGPGSSSSTMSPMKPDGSLPSADL
jgi:hypothetical protein